MKVDLLFGYNDTCYIVANAHNEMMPPKVRKAKIEKIICTIVPAKVRPQNAYETHRHYTCRFETERSTHAISVKLGLIFKTRREAVDKAKEIINQRHADALAKLEEC